MFSCLENTLLTFTNKKYQFMDQNFMYYFVATDTKRVFEYSLFVRMLIESFYKHFLVNINLILNLLRHCQNSKKASTL